MDTLLALVFISSFILLPVAFSIAVGWMLLVATDASRRLWKLLPCTLSLLSLWILLYLSPTLIWTPNELPFAYQPGLVFLLLTWLLCTPGCVMACIRGLVILREHRYEALANLGSGLVFASLIFAFASRGGYLPSV